MHQTCTPRTHAQEQSQTSTYGKRNRLSMPKRVYRLLRTSCEFLIPLLLIKLLSRMGTGRCSQKFEYTKEGIYTSAEKCTHARTHQVKSVCVCTWRVKREGRGNREEIIASLSSVSSLYGIFIRLLPKQFIVKRV